MHYRQADEKIKAAAAFADPDGAVFMPWCRAGKSRHDCRLRCGDGLQGHGEGKSSGGCLTHATMLNTAMKEKLKGAVIERDIAFVVFPGFQIQDLSGPLAAFETAGNLAGAGSYHLHVASLTGGAIASSAGLEVVTKRLRPGKYDTLIVVGGDVLADLTDLFDVSQQLKSVLTGEIRRIASVCTGAFILAADGLLDGRQATTHWKYASQLQQLFPRIKVNGNHIFTKDGHIWTSAGISAGIDMTLAMIEEDMGAAISRATARMLVVYHRRPGGQSQFSALADMAPQSDRIRSILGYMRSNIANDLSVEKLATIACLSPRQFSRIFRAETGYTPAKAVEKLRTEVAKQHLEEGIEPVEVIARRVGYADPERMRRAFIRVTGMPPQSIRRMATAESHSGDSSI